MEQVRAPFKAVAMIFSLSLSPKVKRALDFRTLDFFFREIKKIFARQVLGIFICNINATEMSQKRQRFSHCLRAQKSMTKAFSENRICHVLWSRTLVAEEGWIYRFWIEEMTVLDNCECWEY